MKQITLIRHAKTEVIYSGISDFERQLKTRGRKDARLIASQLNTAGASPHLIISSNAVRAYQTATEMAKAIKYPEEKIEKHSFLYDGFTTQEFIDFIAKKNNQIQSIWVIGHNPEIALLGMNLTNENFFHFPTCSAVVINFNTNKWNEVEVRKGVKFEFLIPSQLKDE